MQIPCEITNISWNGNNFNGEIYGINIIGTDINGQISASGKYNGCTYNATGVVTGWN